MNIIVRMPNWIGDFVMSTAMLADLRDAFPQAEITAMCLRGLTPLLEKDPHINEIFSFTRKRGFVHRDKTRSIVEKLKRGKYDLGLLCTHSLSSAWWFYQGNVERRIGYAKDFRSPLLTDALPLAKREHQAHLVDQYKGLLAPLNISLSETPPKLYLDDLEIDLARKRLETFAVKPEEILIGMNPGAAYGEAKCWPIERFVEAAETLSKRCRILFFGDKEMGWDLPPNVINLSGMTSLREFMALLKLCKVFVTNDSGPMHMADSLGTQVIGIFGSTDPEVTGPFSQGHVMKKDVDCAPCFEKTCPIDFRCMKSISVSEVVQKVEALL